MLAIALTLSVLFSGALSLLCPFQDDPRVTVNMPHPTTCAKYMACVYSKPREMSCPGGLEWNDRQSVCDYPDNADCARDVPEEVARLNGSALAAASACLPQETSECPEDSGPGEVALLKHQDCRKFYLCSGGRGSPMNCPDGLYWNAGSCRCGYESDAECGEDGERLTEEQPEEQVDEVPEEVPEQAEDHPEEQQEDEQTQDQQFDYQPSLRLRRAAEDGESGNSGGSADSGSSGSSGSSSDSGSSGSGSSGGNQAIDDGNGNGDGTVAAGAGIREVSAVAVMLATLAFNAM